MPFRKTWLSALVIAVVATALNGQAPVATAPSEGPATALAPLLDRYADLLEGPADEAHQLESFRLLRQMDARLSADRLKFARELLAYAVARASAPGIKLGQAMAAGTVIRRLDLETDPVLLMQAVEPFAGAQDQPTRATVARFLTLLEHLEYTAPQYESVYSLYLESYKSQDKAPPASMVLLIFSRRPGKALLSCDEAYRQQAQVPVEHRWVTHTVDTYLWEKAFATKYNRLAPKPQEAGRQLQTVVTDPSWWPRLYVATILGQNPELRTPELLKTLRAAKDPYVQKALAAWDTSASSAPATQPAAAPAK